MPLDLTPVETADAALSREQLRAFHLTGRAPGDAMPQGALRPTAPGRLSELPGLEMSYPMCVHPEGGARPFRELVSELEHAGTITSAFRMAMRDRPSVLLEDAATAAIESLTECSAPEIARLRKLLPAGASLAGFHAGSLPLLHAAALAESRRAGRTRFWEDVKRTAARLRDILVLDQAQAPGAISGESVTASLGSRAGAFFNPASLAKALERPANPVVRMEPERRLRCETTLAALDEALQEAAEEPACYLFHPGAADSFAAALAQCDARLDRLAQLLRAVRVARLEIGSAFEPSLHQDMLAHFDWQSAAAEELMAIPPVVVMETAEHLAEASLTSFGKLLRSGRPVQILITRAGLQAQDLSGTTPDFGYLSIAHRESFVLQSSMALSSHLLPGLAAMAKTLRPAIAVVSVPDAHRGESEAWLEDSILVLSRTFPLFSYNPDAGARWADRFRLFTSLPEAADFTPAHAAAFVSGLRQQFLAVPASAWNSDQMELPEYLTVYGARPPLAIPYIWVEGPNGRQRALLTRDLVNFCVDRQRAWELFADLAGAGKSQPVPDGNARQEGAREAIERVIAMLTGPQ
jgi:hypothetical protein